MPETLPTHPPPTHPPHLAPHPQPTNHLDLPAVLWLQDYLSTRWPKTIVAVSHARAFLDAVCTDVLHLHSKKLTPYRGGYSDYEKAKGERAVAARAAAEAAAAKRAHMQVRVAAGWGGRWWGGAGGGWVGWEAGRWVLGGAAAPAARRAFWTLLNLLPTPTQTHLPHHPPPNNAQAFVDRFRYSAARAASAQSRIKALARLDADAASLPAPELVEPDAEYKFSFPAPPDALGAQAFALDGVGFSYPGGRQLLAGVDMTLDARCRVAVVGANGAGKSTLLKLITGELEPTSGRATRNAKVRVAVVWRVGRLGGSWAI